MFVVREELTFEWPVVVELPDPEKPGEKLREEFTAVFKALPSEEAKSIRQRAQEIGEAETKPMVQRVLTGWKDVQNGEKKDLPFSKENLASAMTFSWFPVAVLQAYLIAISPESVEARRTKN